jgi:hypothetical protein
MKIKRWKEIFFYSRDIIEHIELEISELESKSIDSMGSGILSTKDIYTLLGLLKSYKESKKINCLSRRYIARNVFFHDLFSGWCNNLQNMNRLMRISRACSIKYKKRMESKEYSHSYKELAINIEQAKERVTERFANRIEKRSLGVSNSLNKVNDILVDRVDKGVGKVNSSWSISEMFNKIEKASEQNKRLYNDRLIVAKKRTEERMSKNAKKIDKEGLILSKDSVDKIIKNQSNRVEKAEANDLVEGFMDIEDMPIVKKSDNENTLSGYWKKCPNKNTKKSLSNMLDKLKVKSKHITGIKGFNKGSFFLTN